MKKKLKKNRARAKREGWRVHPPPLKHGKYINVFTNIQINNNIFTNLQKYFEVYF